MSAAPERVRRRSQRSAQVIHSCPECGTSLKQDAKWCDDCNFTGAKTLDLFPDSPPPLLPILDAVGLWNQTELKKIQAARDALKKRFPQIHWRICTVNLPAETTLPVFGFWLLNACPLLEKETADDRAWTILLLIDIASGQAAVIPGYAAEHCLGDDAWHQALVTMTGQWSAGKTAEAAVTFFKTSRSLLDASWKRNGQRNSER